MVEQKPACPCPNALILISVLMGLAATGCETPNPPHRFITDTETEEPDHCHLGTVLFPNAPARCLPLQRRPATLLFYFVADSDLEPMLMKDLNEAEAASLPEDARILALVDRAEGFDATDGDWTGAKLFLLSNDNDPERVGSPRVSAPPLGLTAKSGNGEELDMGSPETLARILDFTSEAFPSDELLLHVNGHGGGWGPTGEDVFGDSTNGYRAFGLDRSSGNYLDVMEDLPGALEGRGVDALTFEACGMGNAETVFALWPHVDAVGASAMPIPDSGFDYTSLLGLWQSPAGARSWLTAATEAFAGSFDSSYRVSWAIYDTTGDRRRFAATLDRFAGALGQLDSKSFRTLRDLTPQPNWQQRGMRDLATLAEVYGTVIPSKSADPVLEAIEELVVSSQKSDELPSLRHLLVYLPGESPAQGGPYNPDYEQTAFAEHTGWDDLIRKHYRDAPKSQANF